MGFQINVLDIFATALRKSLVGCAASVVGGVEELMEIGSPKNVRHVAHVTYDRFNGFLGLPVEFEPEVPRRPPSASTRVFGVSTESMHLSFDSRGNCVPTILLMMQRRLYSQGGLQAEGIFRINPENGQEEYVREQLNNGLIPDNIDVHCLAGLIKAWFRELPRGILDSLSPDQVMQAQSEDECAQLVRLLPATEAALLDWAINLMADVAQMENLNKMNARNIAMVFAPNMTQMSDPLTALMYAVQVMNFLKTLIIKIIRERQDSRMEPHRSMEQPEPSDDSRHHSASKPIETDANKATNIEEAVDCSTNTTSTVGKSHSCIADIPNSRPNDGMEDGSINATISRGRSQLRIHKVKTGQMSDATSNKKGTRRHCFHGDEAVGAVKSKEISVIRRVNSCTERAEAWR